MVGGQSPEADADLDLRRVSFDVAALRGSEDGLRDRLYLSGPVSKMPVDEILQFRPADTSGDCQDRAIRPETSVAISPDTLGGHTVQAHNRDEGTAAMSTGERRGNQCRDQPAGWSLSEGTPVLLGKVASG